MTLLEAEVGEQKAIRVKGACVHNLKGVDCSFPLGKLSVVTGPSGSGKSSLVFDTIWTESQRRYTESLPSYVRQILGVWEKPDVEYIKGLIPSVALDARPANPNPRSTVGTSTEIYDYVRFLFSHAGIPCCPSCGSVLKRTPRGKIVSKLLSLPKGTRVQITAPVGVCLKKDLQGLWTRLLKEGFLRVLIKGRIYYLDSKPPEIADPLEVFVVVDRLTVKPEARQRFAEAIETALVRSGGFVGAVIKNKKTLLFCEKYFCKRCNKSLPGFLPAEFSFNNPQGACPECHGLGTVGRVVDGETATVDKKDSSSKRGKRFKKSVAVIKEVCPECKGARLKKESLAVKLGGKNISHVVSLSIEDSLNFFKKLSIDSEIGFESSRVIEEIKRRLKLLLKLGLSYLSLSRPVSSLSAGEHQRLRLAMQIGADLGGILYVLDEPTVGLHPRESSMLVSVLRGLCRKGNTVVIVEHDPYIIKLTDYVLDLGPGAGPEGGKVMAAGTPKEIAAEKDSITGRYLSGELSVASPERRSPKIFLEVKGACENNLKNINARFAIGALTCVTGVSGAGKSTLVIDTLYQGLKQKLNKSLIIPGVYKEILCDKKIKRVVAVNQSPVGRTPRSNPATYTGLFGPVRNFFSKLPVSRVRGYGAKRFSFNAKGGRCEVCRGEGVKRVSMHFLPDILVPCEMCLGKRFNAETLDVRYRGLNISDVLELTVSEAKTFFSAIPKVSEQLVFLEKIGLGYLKLGQRADTLSGGEAQRLKLSRELAHSSRDTLYVLDEPTTGLHQHDIRLLVAALEGLVNYGNTVIVIEHNIDFIKCADFIIDLGPGGGPDGGKIISTGTPEEIAADKNSSIGKYLK